MNKTNLVFLDTETTGIGPEGRLCQLAYKFGGEEFEALFKPPVPIEVEAMAISHITNRMVADKDAFIGSKMQQNLKDIFAAGNILVAHNAEFDAAMLKREDVIAEKMIDTLKIAQHFDDNGEMSRYNLQYLRYYLDLDVADAVAHNALGDIRVLEKLFDYYFEKMLAELGDENKVLEEMQMISSRPALMKKFTFGKYYGSLVKDVADKDLEYLRWLLGEKLKTRGQRGGDDENWIHTLEQYLK